MGVSHEELNVPVGDSACTRSHIRSLILTAVRTVIPTYRGWYLVGIPWFGCQFGAPTYSPWLVTACVWWQVGQRLYRVPVRSLRLTRWYKADPTTVLANLINRSSTTDMSFVARKGLEKQPKFV